MPTIQIRTDDKTKPLPQPFLNSLALTVSEAINLFLRQSVMRCGIPFALTVTEGLEPNTGILDNEFFIDALKQYKSVNFKEHYDIAKIEPILRALEAVDSKKGMRMTLQEKAAKVRLNFKSKNYVIDYNFEEPDNVFILAREDDQLFVKDCKLSNILETLGSFK